MTDRPPVGTLSAMPGPKVALYIPNLAGGGAERVTLNLARGLVARGFAVDVVVASATGELTDHVPPTARLVDLGGLRTMRSLPALARYLTSERPTSLLSAMNHANVVAAWGAKLAGYRGHVVLVEHIQLPKRSTSGWQRAFNLAVGYSYRLATKVVAVSHGVKQSLTQEAGVRSDHIEVIYNPVLRDDFSRKATPARPAEMGPAGTTVALGIGRLEPQKNFELLIRAFASSSRFDDALLVILGEGGDRAKLQTLAADLGVADRVRLPGFVANPFDFLAHANLFVLSSDWEGLPTVLIEALALGTPIVSTDCPSGPREILRAGEYGALVPMGDVAALTSAMVSTLAAPLPPAPLAWLQQFSESAATQRYIEALGLSAPPQEQQRTA